mmetsp:Transcript_5455/g.11878  ORF Transcript_5455/g.11878 Transcript_5455/m.11878 type:complete len:209 (-) Transcript_5455:520-1146(-)
MLHPNVPTIRRVGRFRAYRHCIVFLRHLVAGEPGRCCIVLLADEFRCDAVAESVQLPHERADLPQQRTDNTSLSCCYSKVLSWGRRRSHSRLRKRIQIGRQRHTTHHLDQMEVATLSPHPTAWDVCVHHNHYCLNGIDIRTCFRLCRCWRKTCHDHSSIRLNLDQDHENYQNMTCLCRFYHRPYVERSRHCHDSQMTICDLRLRAVIG